jgi:hypothetical protein
MLERDAVLVAITGGKHPFRDAEVLVDAYAHALAEQIRAAASGDDEDNSWVIHAYDAARLIDPRERPVGSEETTT